MQEARADKPEGKRIEGQGSRQSRQKGREGLRGSRFQQYTSLNTLRARILQEALSAHIMQTPLRRPTPPGTDLTKHCLYHQNSGHDTKECVTLRDKIEELVRAGRLQRYVKMSGIDQYHDRQPIPRPQIPPRQNVRPRSPHREGRDVNVRNHRPSREDGRRERRSISRSRDEDRRRPLRGIINTISGGFAGGGSTSSARKRSIRALRSIHAVDVPKRTMPPITLTNEDFHAPNPDQDDPMVITVEIAQYGVSKVLVDQGSSSTSFIGKRFPKWISRKTS
ncbi:uncharacterized protein LOC106766042 [Vigna radiata var. radiata]|uniref:Uncharacterized protein LOC106766042 n=1 Tax=Vigna radiata var. radiata TaxID=3916 RepID=A0A1S3UJT6_VIGRR|nr:uncharacterized protein LOC106766042 [Vigna radiata var. radiata]